MPQEPGQAAARPNMPNNQKIAGNLNRFTFKFGQRVRVLPPHPDAGATGRVMNAYLFRDGREEVFVSVPGGRGVYEVYELVAEESRKAPSRPHHQWHARSQNAPRASRAP